MNALALTSDRAITSAMAARSGVVATTLSLRAPDAALARRMRTLVETELAARDASNVVNRLKAAGFPVTKTLESFDVASSSIQPKVFDYLSSLEWVRAQANLAIIGPAGTGKSHTLIGLGVAGYPSVVLMRRWRRLRRASRCRPLPSADAPRCAPLPGMSARFSGSHSG